MITWLSAIEGAHRKARNERKEKILLRMFSSRISASLVVYSVLRLPLVQIPLLKRRILAGHLQEHIQRNNLESAAKPVGD